MPPKKKQKTTKPAAPTPRSTRSRTRSESVIASAPPPKRSTRSRSVKAEPEDDVIDLRDDDEDIGEVTSGYELPKTDSWVEVPPTQRPACREDELGLIRPKDMAAFIEKGKYKANEDSMVWHVEQRPADASSFYFTKEDMREDAGPSRYVAVRPKARGGAAAKGKGKTVETTISTAGRAATSSAGALTQPSPATSSRPAPASQVASSQPHSDGLSDIFLGSGQAQDEEAPTFLDGESDEDNRMRQASQRPRTKKSPTMGDRIAQGLASQRSRSSTPRTAPSKLAAAMQEPTREQQTSKKGKERMQEPEPAPASQKEKRSTQGADGSEEPKRKRKGEDLKNLRSELNEDAFARSTGARHKEDFRNKLAAFSQARRKAQIERGESVDSSSDEADDGPQKRRRLGNGKRAETVSSDSDTSNSDSDSDSDSSSSSSDDSKDFIVADDQVEYERGFSPQDDEDVPPPTEIPQARPPTDGRWYDRDADGKIHLAPISHTATGAPSNSILAAHGLGGASARKGLDEMCLDWVEWAAARVLLSWSSLSLDDRKRLERNRAALRSRMRSVEESVSSVAMRRQFKWYLTQYPKIEVEALFSDEVDEYGTLAKNGCGICHRKSQKAQFKVTFSGLRYDQETLGPLSKRDDEDNDADSGHESDNSSDSDSSTSSDRSSDNETWREQGTDSRSHPSYTFFAGQHCAQRAAVMHKLHHWEWTTMQTLAKHDSIRFIRRLLWRTKKQGKGKDGELGCGAWEVALAVNEMISPSGRCVWKGMERAKEGKGKGSELERLRRRLKSSSEQAIEVNRAR
ncbi:protein of unknown function DUF4211 [Kalmanozyma brasiliensis GHG001]|uniref:DUF4211 domain-containing protein n=1 Tax=Kalmanozyma brasiliensis (strain GHG001) TaxID=1365824 RepID=V5GLD8_KALBG|nr:protein of unknown function DUF4211 [Kalmanozyma brasiliensis GHG001]EST06772.1 protein of unknown function DUF4211 [Kalmanozyma brasiliensis GHG001]